jgi:hypothetical protein
MKEAFVWLTAARKTMWIPSKHSRKSVLFPYLNLHPGRTLHNQAQDAGFGHDFDHRSGQALTA